MASWRDNLRRGSWRGIPFLCRDTSNDAGQRVAVFEMPDSDSVYVQSLGRGVKEYRLEIYVVGDGYMAQRDLLEVALDADGPGTLVHPYKGPLQVFAKHPCRLKELSTAGRAAYFDVTFVEAGGPEPPVPGADTAAAAQTATAQLQPILEAAYAPLYDGQPATVQAAFSTALAQVQTAIGAALTAAAGSPQLQDDLAALAAIAPDQPASYAEQLATLLEDYVANLVAAAAPVTDDTLLPGYEDWTRLPPMPPDPSFGLASLAAGISPLIPAAATGQAAANWQMLAQLAQGAATSALATLYAQTSFASSDDADTARELLYGLIVAAIEAAAGDDALVQAWRGVLAASVTDLTTRAKALPNVADFATPSPMPALWLAQRIFQDGTEAPALVQRNAAPHPLFMPTTVEYLQQ